MGGGPSSAVGLPGAGHVHLGDVRPWQVRVSLGPDLAVDGDALARDLQGHRTLVGPPAGHEGEEKQRYSDDDEPPVTHQNGAQQQQSLADQ